MRQFSGGELVSLFFGLYGRVGRILPNPRAGSSLGRRRAVVPGEPGSLHRVLDRRLIATEALLTTELRVPLAHPNLVPRLSEPLAAGPHLLPVEAVMTAPINDVAQITEDFDRVLDDYHLITNEATRREVVFVG